MAANPDKRIRFWMVYNTAKGLPSYRHPTEAEAMAEAKKIAAMHPGDTVFVLEATGHYQVQQPEPIWFGATEAKGENAS